jgi:hypothetical protein
MATTPPDQGSNSNGGRWVWHGDTNKTFKRVATNRAETAARDDRDRSAARTLIHAKAAGRRAVQQDSTTRPKPPILPGRAASMAGAEEEENWGRKEKSEGEKRRLSRRIGANDAAMVLYCWFPHPPEPALLPPAAACD